MNFFTIIIFFIYSCAPSGDNLNGVKKTKMSVRQDSSFLPDKENSNPQQTQQVALTPKDLTLGSVSLNLVAEGQNVGVLASLTPTKDSYDYIEYIICSKADSKNCNPGPQAPGKMTLGQQYIFTGPIGPNTLYARVCKKDVGCGASITSDYEQGARPDAALFSLHQELEDLEKSLNQTCADINDIAKNASEKYTKDDVFKKSMTNLYELGSENLNNFATTGVMYAALDIAKISPDFKDIPSENLSGVLLLSDPSVVMASLQQVLGTSASEQTSANLSLTGPIDDELAAMEKKFSAIEKGGGLISDIDKLKIKLMHLHANFRSELATNNKLISHRMLLLESLRTKTAIGKIEFDVNRMKAMLTIIEGKFEINRIKLDEVKFNIDSQLSSIKQVAGTIHERIIPGPTKPFSGVTAEAGKPKFTLGEKAIEGVKFGAKKALGAGLAAGAAALFAGLGGGGLFKLTDDPADLDVVLRQKTLSDLQDKETELQLSLIQRDNLFDEIKLQLIQNK